MAKIAKRRANPIQGIVTTPYDPTRRRELWLVAILTLIGAIFRLRGLAHLGLTQFDEGIYAFAGLWAVTPNGLDPQVIAYAPPGFPILVGLSYALLGIGDSSAILVAILCGIVTIPVSAWVGRRTFGPGAGAATAAFAALSMAHIAFSRKALTDAPFLLFWLIAIGVGGWFLEKPRFARALALGFTVALAQNFKYNGWIAGVVVALAAVFGLIANPETRNPRESARIFGWGIFAGVVVAACYAPWFIFVQGHGGYAALIAHQRSYLGGTVNWLPYLRQQIAQTVALSGGSAWRVPTWIVAALGVFGALHGLNVLTRRSGLKVAGVCLGSILLFTPILAQVEFAWWLGLASVYWLSNDPRPTYRVLAAFWLIPSIMTPFYHPYARLWLPLEGAGWLILGGLTVSLEPILAGRFDRTRENRVQPSKNAVFAVVLVICLGLWGTVTIVDHPVPFPWTQFSLPTDSFRNAVADILQHSRFPKEKGVTLRTLARRPLAFYLALQGTGFVRILPDRSGIDSGPGTTGDWAIVDEVQLGSRLDVSSVGQSIPNGWRVAAIWPMPLDPVTLLDVNPASASEVNPSENLRLFLLEPATTLPILSGPHP